MLIPTEENFEHSATRLVKEENGRGVHAHKFAFNQGDMCEVIFLDLTAHAFIAAQVELTVAVESGR